MYIIIFRPFINIIRHLDSEILIIEQVFIKSLIQDVSKNLDN